MCLRPCFRFVRYFIFAAFLFAVRSDAQITNVTNSTSTPTPGVGHDYLGLLGETVNPANGSLSVRINVPVPKGRGLTLPFAFTYESNSAGLQPKPSQPNQLQWQYAQEVFASGPWSYSLPQLTAIIQKYQQPPTFPVNPCYSTTGYVFRDASGGRHSLNISAVLSNLSQTSPPGVPSCHSAPGGSWSDYFTGGDDFYRAQINGIAAIGTYGNIANAGAGAGQVQVADASGTVYTFGTNTFTGWNCAPGTQVQMSSGTIVNATAYSMPSSIEDRNGNVITISQPCAGTSFSISDTTGRNALSFQASGGLGATTISSVAVSGITQPYTVTEGGNAGTSVNVNATQVAVIATPNNCTGVPAWQAAGTTNSNWISAITLPNGKQYQFTYDPTYGQLSKITYPEGGYISYTWGLNPQSALVKYTDTQAQVLNDCIYTYDKPAVLHRYVSFDGQTIALQQDFSYSTTWGGPNYTWTSLQTTVTTRDLVRGTSFQTVYAYSPIQVQSLPNTPLNYWDSVLPVESTITYKDTNGQTLRTVAKTWSDAYEMATESHTWDNGQVSSVGYSYGPGHTITDKKEFDFGQTGTPSRETVTTYQSFANTPIFPSGPSIFDKPATVITKGNGTRLAETDFSYDQFTLGPVSNLPTGTHDETNYAATSTAPRGNATTVTRQCFQGGTSCQNSVSTFTFDETGQTLAKVDPCGNAACSDMTGTNHTTTFSYADNFDSPPTSSTNAYVTQIADPLGHTQKFKYAFADGQLISSIDQNNLTTQYIYNDSMRRITETDFPDGGKTTVSYNDNAPNPSVTTSKQINASQSVTSVSVLNGLGHPIQTQLTSDPQGTVFSDTTYDGLGLVKSATNPYRAGTDPTTSSGTTTFVYDSLGRKTSETKPDGSTIVTAYCGPNTLVTDPTGRWRRSRSDALGHLVEVDEPNAVGATVAATGCPGTGEPIWVTSYSYDALNNLLQVIQNGSHQRSFTYDSLSRMLTSNNPEVGTLTYVYDPNGNVSTKQDARAITATYGYDVVSRILSVSYSNGDAGSAFTYDQPNCLGLPSCQNVGQRTSATDAAGSEAWSYQVDATNLRSIHVNQRTTVSSPSNITKTSTYYLDLASNITQVIYPTGRVVNYAYDSANRAKTASDGSNGITYATGFQSVPAGCITGAVCYTPQGTFYALSIGQTSAFSGLNLTHVYNNRLQPLEFKASSNGGSAIDITYSFADPLNGNHNAGHVFSITNNLDSTRSQVFTLDQINRIASAKTTSTYATSPGHCWGETYNVDAWSNLQTVAQTTDPAYTGCTQESGFTKTADANNHLSGFGYDPSGNTLNDGVNAYTWDGESQLKSAAGVNYLYDGDGRRVSKSNGKLYWYGSGGEILSETDAFGNTTADYVFFGGKRVAMVPSNAISNPGFEQGWQGWSNWNGGNFQVITDATRAHSGNNYMQVSTSTGTGFQAAQLAVSPGQQVNFGGWAYLESGSGAYVRWKLMALDANHNPVGYPDPSPSSVTSAAWTYQVGSYTVPAGVSYVLLYGEIYLPTGATVARFDDGFLTFGSYAGATPTYYVEDLLGSSRVVTDNNGVVCYDADFYPYGGERTVTNSCTQNVYKFEGKERDTETGNDDFGARYYSNRFGRWLSADWSSVPAPVPYANLTNPQTLNLYAMVSDDPESFADLDGHFLNHGMNTCAGLGSIGCSPLENELMAEAAAQQQAQQQQNQPTQRPAQQQQMSLSSQGLDFIKSYEQFRASPYTDQAGILTIGYGHVILPGESFTKITEKEATALLANDVGKAVSAVNKSLKVTVSQNQFDALVSITFNAGPKPVAPQNTIMSKINGGRVVEEKDFTAYNKVRTPNGSLKVSRGLTNRRLDEYKIFSTSDYERTQ